MATHSQIAENSYHDTISKMARKYSQYQLPDPSELDLIESDDEELNEDEDILSDTLTMLSHKSQSHIIKPYALLRKQSSKSIASKSVHFGSTSIEHFNPMEEIREIQMDRAYFIDIFDKYFDESKEGDVDLDEFEKGLIKLGMDTMTAADDNISKLFNVLLINGDADGDNDGYLQSEQFSDFLTRRFDAPQLIAYQELLLNLIVSNCGKNSSRHRLINAEDAKQWDTTEVSLAEIEMRQAMEQMVDNEMEKIKVKQEFTEELERRSADPSFCEELNAKHWSKYEVAHWVQNNGYQYAMKRFYDFEIDGNVLLYDVNSAMLLNQLGISSLHCNKFMRVLHELKEKNQVNKMEEKMHLSEDYNINFINYESQTIERHNKWREKLLNLQDEIHKSEEKYILSQEEIVTLKSKHNQKMIDYETIKNSYDEVCKSLNESKQSMNSLRKMNDLLSDENKQLKNNIIIEQETNPYLLIKKEANDPYAFLQNNMQLNGEDPQIWSCQQVAYWLTTIGMKKYLAQFMEQFVDGQILLNDISALILMTDLEVKSLHAPKIMREIKKLRKLNGDQLEITEFVCNFNISSTQNEAFQSKLQLIEELKTQTAGLKTDLSETRMKLSASRAQIEEYKSTAAETASHHMHLRSESNLTSVYSEGDQRRKISSSSVIMDIMEREATPPLPQDLISNEWRKYIQHLESKCRELSHLFLRADNNLKKYTKAIIPFQERIHNLELQNETRKKTIDKLNKRIDRRNESIKKLKLHQAHAHAQSSLLYATNNMNMNPSIASSVSSASPPYLAHAAASNSAMELTQEQELWFNNAQRSYSRTHHDVKTHKYAHSGQLLQAKKKRNYRNHYKKMHAQQKNNIILSHDPTNNGVNVSAAYRSHASSIHSAPDLNEKEMNSNNENSIIGSLSGITSMAYGYFMGNQTNTAGADAASVATANIQTPGNYYSK